MSYRIYKRFGCLDSIRILQLEQCTQQVSYGIYTYLPTTKLIVLSCGAMLIEFEELYILWYIVIRHELHSGKYSMAALS